MYRRKRKTRPPIPYSISFELAFLPESLSEQEYEEQVRAIVRDKLPSVSQQMADKIHASLWDEYDDKVSDIIEEELARN